MIKIENLVKTFGEIKAVDNLNLDVKKGELCVIIGPSGCGKSTLLKMINRMEIQTSGEIFINNENIKKKKTEILRRSIGYVIQSIGLFPHMSVHDNIAIVPKLLKWDKVRINSRVLELLELIGLEPEIYCKKYPHELSGGEAQRIGVARALAADPPILLMDEPFGAVDPLGRLTLQNEFLLIQKKLQKTVIFVTHDLDEAIRLADKIAIVKDGKIVQYDDPETILSEPKDSFVRDFVGSDRSLKKLVRYEASKVMKKPNMINIDSETIFKKLNDCIKRKDKFIWAVDTDLYLKGWIDLKVPFKKNNPLAGFIQTNISEIAVNGSDSLKSVLSKMLGQSIQIVPIIDDSGKLIGEISLHDIEGVF